MVNIFDLMKEINACLYPDSDGEWVCESLIKKRGVSLFVAWGKTPEEVVFSAWQKYNSLPKEN